MRLSPIEAGSTLLLALIPVTIVRNTLRAIDDPDAFWHLAGGEHILDTHVLAGPDYLGTFTARPWVQGQWLGEVAMALAQRAAGLAGLALMTTFAAVVMFVLLYVMARPSASPIIALTTAGVAWVAMSASLSPRPQIASFICLAVTVMAGRGAALDGRRPPLWLVPLTWLWACLHGFWILGPLVTAGLVLGGAVGHRSRRTVPVGMAVAAGSALAGLFTPLLWLVLAADGAVAERAALIDEWRPPTWSAPYAIAGVTLVIAATLGLWHRKRAMPDLVLTFGAVASLVGAARLVAVAAVLATPPAAAGLQRLVGRAADPVRRSERPAMAVGMLIAAITAGVMAPSLAAVGGAMPAALLPQLRALPPGAVVLNDDFVGGWLYWSKLPLRPTMDTRMELYDIGYLRAYINARDGGEGWRDYVTATRASAALLRRDAPLAQLLVRDLGWRQEADAEGFVLLEVGP